MVEKVLQWVDIVHQKCYEIQNCRKKPLIDDYALDKINLAIQNVGSQAFNQLSTKIRTKKKYKTNRKDLDGAGLDIQKQLAKLGELHLRTPSGKKYDYCGPGTRLQERLNSNNPSIRDPIIRLDRICQAHDIAYSQTGNDLAKKHKAYDVMVKAIGDIPFSQRPWFSTPVKYTMQAKTFQGLGVKRAKNGKRR